MPSHQKLQVLPFDDLIEINFNPNYASTLPSYLLQFIDDFIKQDSFHCLHYKYLHYSLDQLLKDTVLNHSCLWLFLDPHGEKHIIIENIEKKSYYFPDKGDTFNEKISPITPQIFSSLWYKPNKFYVKNLRESELQYLSHSKLICIDQIRLKCKANCYFTVEEITSDFKALIAWNQVYRSKTSKSIKYLSNLFACFIQLINTYKLSENFHFLKTHDFKALLNHQLSYKLQTNQWPKTPSHFRSYQKIENYHPTPCYRENIIKKRLKSNKKPVECPDNCVCYRDNEKNFCQYTLKDSWETTCPNRFNRIQCSHSDQRKMEKCRNSQIKKKNSLRCKTEEQFTEGFEIEECIVWGIDLHTRKVIYNCLPQCDIDVIDCVENKEQRNNFIEKTLMKAINSLGNEGYSIEKACNLIMNEKQFHSIQTEENLLFNTENQYAWKSSFLNSNAEFKSQYTKKQRFYASVLLKNYHYCHDKSAFRIHTKGKGAKCIDQSGIQCGKLIVQYFGQLYEPWRWYQRESFIKEIVKRNKSLRNLVPQFYNIYLQTHRDDPDGSDLMIVDPVQKGNFSSRFSHSCNPNCGTVVTVSEGKYYIGMYSFRDIEYGEQLTFDYCSMTESLQEHTDSICLCGMENCRGNYLELANSKAYNDIMDKNSCFLLRNSFILRSLEPLTKQDEEICNKHNIKSRMIDKVPDWLKKWIAVVLRSVQQESEVYKKELREKWNLEYPWKDKVNKKANIENYSETFKENLISIRLQNLSSTVDKIKYLFSEVDGDSPPLYYVPVQYISYYLIRQKLSVLNEIQDVLVQQCMKEQSTLVQHFIDEIERRQQHKQKLFFFRLCCLIVSHQCLSFQNQSDFNHLLFSDLIYFYAFTHTYFTSYEYKAHISSEISITHSQITGNENDHDIEKTCTTYDPQFIWGQLAFWFTQTVKNPQSMLSSNRRGSLSYPYIKSVGSGKYPLEKHCRQNFHRLLKEKCSTGWGTQSVNNLSFKNPNKLYGSAMFESVHNAHKLKELKGNMLDICLNMVNKSLKVKLELFKKVERLLENTAETFDGYSMVGKVLSKQAINKEPKICKIGLDGHSKKKIHKQEL